MYEPLIHSSLVQISEISSEDRKSLLAVFILSIP